MKCPVLEKRQKLAMLRNLESSLQITKTILLTNWNSSYLTTQYGAYHIPSCLNYIRRQIRELTKSHTELAINYQFIKSVTNLCQHYYQIPCNPSWITPAQILDNWTFPQ